MFMKYAFIGTGSMGMATQDDAVSTRTPNSVATSLIAIDCRRSHGDRLC